MKARWLITALCVGAPAALANTFETYGFGPRAEAMAGALTAATDDYTAVFYNPSMLVLRKDINFGFSFDWHRVSGQVASVDSNRPVDCTYCTPPDSVGYTTGLLFPLGGKVKNRLALGFGIHLPTGVVVRTQAADPDRPYWYHYASSPERIALLLGAGVRITDWLALGVGVQALADLVGEGATLSVDLTNRRVTSREIDSHLASRLGPTAGLYLSPTRGLRLGLSYRGEMWLFYQIPAKVELEGLGTMDFVVQGYTHYTPHTFSGGISWDPTDDLTVSLDGIYGMWSRAPSPYVQVQIQMSGPTLHGLGLDDAFNIASPEQKPGFADTLSGRLGLEYRIGKRFAMRGGAYYRPTPVPKQDVPGTNILDCDTLGAGIGVGYSFDDPLEVFQEPVKVDLSATGALLFPREAKKEPTDTVPSYTYEAKLVGVNAAIRYDF